MPAKSNKTWTPEEDKRLLELEAAGKSIVSIAAKLRRSGGAILGRLYVLKARERLVDATSDSPKASQPNRWTINDDKRLVELRASGASFDEIAKSLGRTRSAVVQRTHVLKHSPMAD